MANTIRRIRQSVQKLAARVALSKAETGLAADVVQGITQSGSCHLSEIGRALDEDEPIAATEHRLSEGMARKRSKLDALGLAYLGTVAPVAAQMPFIAVDPTDLVKPYGRAFEHLDTVRDASDRRKPIDPGYWCVRIEATDENNNTLPLYTEVFSTKAPEYTGWNETFWNAIETVASRVNGDQVWLFDRAFDGNDHLQRLQRMGKRWVVRQQQNRNIKLANDQTFPIDTFVFWLNKPHQTEIPYVDKCTHEMKSFTVHFGYAPVRLPDLDADVWVIAVRRPGRDLLVLYTDRRPRSADEAASLIRAYMRRWGVEDGIRFWKQKTGIEDFRVRAWESIRRLAVLAMIAQGLQAVWLLTRPALAERFIARVKAFIPQVPFMQYRLWDGVRAALLAGA